jgi:hypothetical protein
MGGSDGRGFGVHGNGSMLEDVLCRLSADRAMLRARRQPPIADLPVIATFEAQYGLVFEM